MDCCVFFDDDWFVEFGVFGYVVIELWVEFVEFLFVGFEEFLWLFYVELVVEGDVVYVVSFVGCCEYVG